MRYRVHYGGAPGVQPSFGIVVDDAANRWASDPPGFDLPQAMLGVYCILEGPEAPIASGKTFDLFPGGRAQESKK